MFNRRTLSGSLFAFFILLAIAAPALAADVVSFTYRAPQVGQQASHDMQFSLDLNVSLHQAGQTISSDDQQLSRNQDRQVTVMQVEDRKAMKVQVFYATAREKVCRGKMTGTPQAEPIEGKSYVVERRGADLVVTDPTGNSVSEDEQKLVASSMDAVGRPSPLGTLLDGKKIAIGEKLKLPKDMASDLLGVKDSGNEAQKVELTLDSTSTDEDGRHLAKFNMLVVLKDTEGPAMDVKGTIQIEPDTCQIAEASFEGPVSMHQQEGPKGHTFDIDSRGTMKVAVRSHYIR